MECVNWEGFRCTHFTREEKRTDEVEITSFTVGNVSLHTFSCYSNALMFGTNDWLIFLC
jgi:hypothetical protein